MKTVPPPAAAQASTAFWMASWARSSLIPVAPKSLTLKTRREGRGPSDSGFLQDGARTMAPMTAMATMEVFDIASSLDGTLSRPPGRWQRPRPLSSRLPGSSRLG